MNNQEFEIQDKDFKLNELCAKCSHLYIQHIMFAVNPVNSKKATDGWCNMCECQMFIPSGKFKE